MQKFIALYLAPASIIEEWMKTDPETRKTEEAKMRADWQTWTMEHGQSISETAGAGKTKRVSTEGVQDIRNDVMLYSIVEVSSHDEAAKMFLHHPHLGIPGASIEIMQANVLQGMQ